MEPMLPFEPAKARAGLREQTFCDSETGNDHQGYLMALIQRRG